MARLLLITFLLLISSTVYAGWVKVGASDDGMTLYVDPDTIRRNGNLVKMWQLYDLTTIRRTGAGDSYLSSKNQHEFDCVEERIRTLAFTWFSGNMGHGNAVFTVSDEQKWEPISPESAAQTLWNIVCNKK